MSGLAVLVLQQYELGRRDFREIDLSGADLREANLSGANLSGANLRETDLRQAQLLTAQLCEANLWGASLTGASLTGANLSGADLRNTILSGAILNQANLAKVRFSNACYDQETQFPDDFDPIFHDLKMVIVPKELSSHQPAKQIKSAENTTNLEFTKFPVSKNEQETNSDKAKNDSLLKNPVQDSILEDSSYSSVEDSSQNSYFKWPSSFWAAITVGIVGMILLAGASWFLRRENISYSSACSSDCRTFQDVKEVPEGLFSYGGSTTWAPIRQLVDQQLQTARPELELRYTSPLDGGVAGSGTGIRMLLAGQLDFAQSSRPLTEEEYKAAVQRNFQLKQVPVAIDAIVVVANPSLSLQGLTIEQLRQIYLGEITDWSEVGGPRLPIIAYSKQSTYSATAEFMQENILKEKPFGPQIKYINNTTEALRKVSNTAGSVYYASAPEVVPQCGVKPLSLGRVSNELIAPYEEPYVPLDRCPQERNRLNTNAFRDDRYPFTRRLFVIIKQNQDREEQVGQAYADLLLTEEGQDLIEKAGFTGSGQ